MFLPAFNKVGYIATDNNKYRKLFRNEVQYVKIYP